MTVFEKVAQREQTTSITTNTNSSSRKNLFGSINKVTMDKEWI